VAAAQRRAGELIDAGAPLYEVLAQLTAAVEELSGGTTVGSILVLDAEGLLRNGASPNLPADYLDAIDRIRPDPQLGTCAAAAATGEAVFTPDFCDDLKWAELRHLPLALGFLGAWSWPIKADGGRVLGTFGTYFRERRLPTAGEMDTVRRLASVAARAIERSTSAASAV
jgi:GAF domain-containing protein